MISFYCSPCPPFDRSLVRLRCRIFQLVAGPHQRLSLLSDLTLRRPLGARVEILASGQGDQQAGHLFALRLKVVLPRCTALLLPIQEHSEAQICATSFALNHFGQRKWLRALGADAATAAGEWIPPASLSVSFCLSEIEFKNFFIFLDLARATLTCSPLGLSWPRLG